MAADPSQWTVLEVANFFRHHAVAYIADLPNRTFPDMDALAQVLESNQIDGFDVMHGVINHDFLRDECHIKSFKLRKSIDNCVQRLQERRTAEPPGAHPTPVQTPKEDAIGENKRPGEEEVIDDRGRKRRKLNLPKPSDLPSLAPLETAGLSDKNVPALEDSAIEQDELFEGYLPSKAVNIDEIFFGDAKLGQAIGELQPSGDILEGTWQDSTYFTFQNQEKPAGQIDFVYKQMRNFLRDDTAKPVKRHGRHAMAIIPYRARLLPQNKVQSALVVQMPSSQPNRANDDEQEAITIRENVTYLDADGYDAEEQKSGEWDFLVDKYGGQQEEVAEYDPESQSITSSLAEEIAREVEEIAMHKQGMLGRNEVKTVVQESIDAFANKWREDELPKLEKNRAWSIWKKTKRSKTIRNDLIAHANSTIAMLDDRLQNQLIWFLREEWKSKNSIAELCSIMQPTVEDREEARWKIDVWRRTKEPYHEVRRNKRSTTSKPKSTIVTDTGIVIPPNDRLSVEPAADGGANEEFHTPEAGSPDPDEHLNDEGDEMEDDSEMDEELETENESSIESPLADFVEDDPPLLIGSPEGSARSVRSGYRSGVDASGSESDLSDFRKFIRSPSKPEPKSSSSTLNGRSGDIIEISSDSSLPSVKKKVKKLSRKDVQFEATMQPSEATVAQVRAWDLDELAESNDRQRLLIKMLSEAGSDMRRALQKCMIRLRPLNFGNTLQNAMLKYKADHRDVGGNPEENTMHVCTKIYLAWFFVRPDFWSGSSTNVQWTKILFDTSQRDQFVSMLRLILQKNETSLFVTPEKFKTTSSSTKQARFDSSIVVNLDSDDDSDEVQTTPSKKYKKKLSERAINKQSQAQIQSALQRQAKFDKAIETQKSNSQQLAAMLPPGTPSESAILINPLKDDDEEAIYVDSKIAPRMKDHQIRGVQFMWRELTVTDNGKAHGCVLAHTMGLGKTMQAITVLVALDEAARSENPAVFEQMPKSLRRPQKEGRQLRIFILCPPVLLANWKNEFDKWARDKFPRVFVAEAGRANQKRTVTEWHDYGGILLMGYQNFGRKIPLDGKTSPAPDEHQGSSKRRRQAAPKDEDLAKMILEGAEVVVADEAHALKTDTTVTTQAASKFKTLTRLALTGTPMSNDVKEIYSLISWVDPMYLGDKGNFQANYAKPIKIGQSEDSTHYQRRKSLQKLSLLHKRIGPKVDRANIEVLRDSLTPKVEFHLTLPLTDVQRTTYTKFVKALRGGTQLAQADQVTIFQWLALLTLLANHPVTFKEKLLSPPQQRKPQRKVKEVSPGTSDGSVTPLQDAEDPDPDDEAEEGARALGFDKTVIDSIVADITNNDYGLSAKMIIVMDIVRLSKRCGDKLIIFTQSIITLDYMTQLFRSQGISCGRIDGSIPTNKRMPILESFKNGEFDLMIISTRAGGTGLNIQTANRVVIIDSHFNPAHEEQAIGRAYRLGQTKPVFVYRLVSGGTFEEDIWKRQNFKTGLTLRVIDKKQVKRSGNHNSREYLYLPKEIEQTDVSEYLGRDKAVLDHILENETSSLVRAIHTTETLQAEVVEKLTDEEQAEVDQIWQAERNAGLTGRVGNAPPPPPPPPPSTAPARRTMPAPPVPAGSGSGQGSLIARLPMSRPPAGMNMMPHGLPTSKAPSSTMPPPKSRPN